MSTDVLYDRGQSARQSRSDAAVHRDLQAAYEANGRRPMSYAVYDRLKPAGALSAVRLLQRHGGSWRAACLAADVEPCEAQRTYVKTFTVEQMWATVEAYLGSEGATGSYADFTRWTRERPGQVPSAQTCRNALGTWNSIKGQFC